MQQKVASRQLRGGPRHLPGEAGFAQPGRDPQAAGPAATRTRGGTVLGTAQAASPSGAARGTSSGWGASGRGWVPAATTGLERGQAAAGAGFALSSGVPPRRPCHPGGPLVSPGVTVSPGVAASAGVTRGGCIGRAGGSAAGRAGVTSPTRRGAGTRRRAATRRGRRRAPLPRNRAARPGRGHGSPPRRRPPSPPPRCGAVMRRGGTDLLPGPGPCGAAPLRSPPLRSSPLAAAADHNSQQPGQEGTAPGRQPAGPGRGTARPPALRCGPAPAPAPAPRRGLGAARRGAPPHRAAGGWAGAAGLRRSRWGSWGRSGWEAGGCWSPREHPFIPAAGTPGLGGHGSLGLRQLGAGEAEAPPHPPGASSAGGRAGKARSKGTGAGGCSSRDAGDAGPGVAGPRDGSAPGKQAPRRQDYWLQGHRLLGMQQLGCAGRWLQGMQAPRDAGSTAAGVQAPGDAAPRTQGLLVPEDACVWYAGDRSSQGGNAQGAGSQGMPQQACEGVLQHLGWGEAVPRVAGCWDAGDAGLRVWGHLGRQPPAMWALPGVAEVYEPPPPCSQPVPAPPVWRVSRLVNDNLSAGVSCSHSRCSEALPPSAVGSVGAEVPGLWQFQLLGVPFESPQAAGAGAAEPQQTMAVSKSSSSALGADRL